MVAAAPVIFGSFVFRRVVSAITATAPILLFYFHLLLLLPPLLIHF
jgi:hypothetical protein